VLPSAADTWLRRVLNHAFFQGCAGSVGIFKAMVIAGEGEANRSLGLLRNLDVAEGDGHVFSAMEL
jgi:hypothetical protein